MDRESIGEAAASVSPSGGGLMTRWVELIVGLLIVSAGSVVVYDSLRIGVSWENDGPQAGYFPFLVGSALTLAGLWIAAKTVWGWKRLAGDVFVSRAKLKPVLAMLLPSIAYVVLIQLIGIYLASALFIGAFMIWQGKYRWPPALGVALGVPIVTFALFELWFLVSLPKGPIERMLGF